MTRSVEEVLQEHTDHDKKAFTDLQATLAQLGNKLEGVDRQVTDMRQELARYKGFMGGVAFVIGGIVTVVGLLIGYFR